MEMGDVGNVSDRLSCECTGHEIGVNLPFEGEKVQCGWSSFTNKEVSGRR